MKVNWASIKTKSSPEPISNYPGVSIQFLIFTPKKSSFFFFVFTQIWAINKKWNNSFQNLDDNVGLRYHIFQKINLMRNSLATYLIKMIKAIFPFR